MATVAKDLRESGLVGDRRVRLAVLQRVFVSPAQDSTAIDNLKFTHLYLHIYTLTNRFSAHSV